MKTEFIHLNKDWNAEPNAPSEKVDVRPGYLELSFYVNPWAYEGYKEEQRAAIRFYGCSRWRLGSVNILGRMRDIKKNKELQYVFMAVAAGV